MREVRRDAPAPAFAISHMATKTPGPVKAVRQKQNEHVSFECWHDVTSTVRGICPASAGSYEWYEKSMFKRVCLSYLVLLSKVSFLFFPITVAARLAACMSRLFTSVFQP